MKGALRKPQRELTVTERGGRNLFQSKNYLAVEAELLAPIEY